MFKIAVFIGSPRTHGANDLAVEEVLKGAASCGEIEFEKIWLNKQRITPCQSCDSCMKTGRCRLRDDMDGIYETIIAMDAFVLAAPIYFSGMSAQAKVMIDRCQPFWSAKYVLKTDLFAGKTRPGVFIATGGQPLYEGQFIGSLHVVNLLYKMIGVKSVGHITIPDLEERPLNGRPDELAQAFALGQALMGKR